MWASSSHKDLSLPGQGNQGTASFQNLDGRAMRFHSNGHLGSCEMGHW